MSKVITSPVARYPGTVTISDPMTAPQCFAFEDARDEAREKTAGGDLKNRKNYRVYQAALLPAVTACVERCDLTANGQPVTLTPETFPASPVADGMELFTWLHNAVMAVYLGETAEVPLAS